MCTYLYKFESVDNYIHFHLLRANLIVKFFLTLINFYSLYDSFLSQKTGTNKGKKIYGHKANSTKSKINK